MYANGCTFVTIFVKAMTFSIFFCFSIGEQECSFGTVYVFIITIILVLCLLFIGLAD